MKYMLLVYSPEAAWTKEEWVACTVASSAVCAELDARGQFVAAAPLEPVATAVSVRVRHGGPLLTTGPFAETTEQLGGFFLVEVADLDAAIAIAARLSAAAKGTVEIRPLAPLADLPADRFIPVAGGSRYLLLCYDDDAAWNALGPAALAAAQAEAVTLACNLAAQGRHRSCSPLHPISTATSVRLRAGKLLVTDGPFAETREVLGGYYLIAAHDVNEAIAAAVRHPGAHLGTVEIRRLVDLPVSSAPRA